MTLIRDQRIIAEMCQKAGIPSLYVISLRRGLDHAFEDGRSALLGNALSTTQHHRNLEDCSSCSQLIGGAEVLPSCVDNDLWARECDGAKYGEVKPSSDMLILVEHQSLPQVLLVEAKLGALGGVDGRRPRHPTHIELREKQEWSKVRVGDNVPVFAPMYVLFSKNSFQKMRNRIARYNREDHAHPLVCACVDTFLSDLAVSIRTVTECDQRTTA